MPNWNGVLNEIQTQVREHSLKAKAAHDTVRKKYIKKLSHYTGRNTIAYYSGFLSKPNLLQADINDEDKNGFMSAIHGLDRTKGLDLILHTPGGNLAATQSLVHYLHQMFDDDIRAIVPQLAMSAGTMIACSCKSIVMGKQSNLGPVDPQLRGIPAVGVVKEFQRAFREIKADPAKMNVWSPILSKYSPTFLMSCENAIKRSKEFVKQQLSDVMFKGVRGKDKKIAKIIKDLTNYEGGHDRHIHVDECENIGLVIERLEEDNDLQDLVLTAHHAYMHTLMNTPAFKVIENQKGIALIKNQSVNQQ